MKTWKDNRSVRPPYVLTVVVTVVVMSVGGCAERDDITGAPPSTSTADRSLPASTTSAEVTPADASPSFSEPEPTLPDDEVIAVAMRRSGGLKPLFIDRIFATDQPPPKGFTRGDLQAVLNAASDPALTTAAMKPVPAQTCCDRFLYVVTVKRADGSMSTFTTLSGLTQPKPFERLLEALA